MYYSRKWLPEKITSSPAWDIALVDLYTIPFTHYHIVTRKCEHCGGEPEQAANMHMNKLSFTLKWWAELERLWVSFMHYPYLKRSQTAVYILYGRRAACRWWSVRSCCDKQEVRCRASLYLSRLPRYGCQRCTLAVAQQVHEDVQFSGNIWMRI